MASRPRAVTVTACFLFAATAIATVVGCALFFPGTLLDWLAQFNQPGMAAFQVMGRWPGIFLIGLGAGTTASGIGLLRGRRWAWWFAIVLFMVDALGDVVSFFITKDLLRSGSGIAICALFLFALSRDGVKRYFSADKDGRAAS